MKKILGIFFFMAFLSIKSQYLIVGKDSISAEKFKTENQNGLEKAGIDKTVKSYVDFHLLQQFALAKKADTMSYFKKTMFEKEKQLRAASFYPQDLIKTMLQQYFSANLLERKIQVFYLEKANYDARDYNQIYQEVTKGKISMEDAIFQYTKQKTEPFFVKAGSIDVDLEKELLTLQPGGYTRLINSTSLVAFAKLIDTRPSLGYLVFGSISYPQDADAEKMKNQIMEALKSGKKFEEVAALYGSTENEKKNAGVVMGSPILPEKVYAALKGKRQGEYTEPVEVEDKFYIFNIYSLIPYQDAEKYNAMFTKEMMTSQFADLAYQKLIERLVASALYKETPDFATIKKSFRDYLTFRNDKAVLYQYGNKTFRFGALKKVLSANFKNADRLSNEQWALFINSKRGSDVFAEYSKNFLEREDIKKELKEHKQSLLADFLYSFWIEEELKNKPKILDDHYEAHQDQYLSERTANARVAIITDLSVENKVFNEIGNPQKWERLQKKYYGKTNDKGQSMVHFEKGEMSENAEVFKTYKVPLILGVHKVKIQDKLLLIAIDDIVPAKPLSREEALDQVKQEVKEGLIQNIISEQYNKTQVTIETSFLKELEKNFKK